MSAPPPVEYGKMRAWDAAGNELTEVTDESDACARHLRHFFDTTERSDTIDACSPPTSLK